MQEPKRGPQNSWSFRLKGVLDNVSQEEMYDRVCRPVVQGALDGYNGTVMCFGQTGAGKTYTLTGSTKSYQQRGFIPRALQQVFQDMKKRTDSSFSVHVSFMEIYNETLFDLLSQVQDSSPPSPQGIVVLEEPGRGVLIRGLSVHPVLTEEDALDLFFEGKMNCITGSNSLNRNSSRSHCIFNIHIESRSRTLCEAKYITSKLSLVDLAGSERVGKTGSEGQMFKEATYINKSLSFLEQAILALADRRRDHVPFRQTKLTYVLKDSLGGNCNTVLVANIYGEAKHIDETISTLRFASRMKNVQTEPAINEQMDPVLQIKKLEREVQVLKEELAIHNTLAMRPDVKYEPLSEAQLADISSQVQSYLDGSLKEINVISIKQVQGVFAQFKLAVQKQEQKAQTCDTCSLMKKDQGPVKESDRRQDAEAGSIGASTQKQTQRPSKVTSRRKKSRDKHSTTLGEGSPSPRPRSESSSRKMSSVQTSDAELESPEPDDENPDTQKSQPPESESPSHKSKAFENFKLGRGSQINGILRDNKAVLLERHSLLLQLTEKVKAVKRAIEGVMFTIQQRKQMRAAPDDDDDEEEAELVLQLSELKTLYQQRHKALLDIKEEVNYCEHLVDQCGARLVAEFETWYEKTFLLPEEELDSSVKRLELINNKEQCPSAQSFYNAHQRTQKRRIVRAQRNSSARFSDRSLPSTQPAT
nr:PREDICTED: kinesin-like protein KIF9 [Paralichthys olivaceus]